MKRNIAIVVISLSLFAACTSAPKDQSQADTVATTAVADTEPQNQLTEQEKADGWKLLFNGENLDGWKIYKGKENNSWEVLDGTLHCKPFDAAEKRADIMTADEYQNFELTFDWKITPQGNSGVMFRVTEAFDQPYLSGPEYQVID
ncbi:MAG: family 16 glycoside hydrolase, partial [Bacteroidota bacterium]